MQLTFHPNSAEWAGFAVIRTSGLLEDQHTGVGITAEGRRALQRVLAGD